MEDTSVRDGDAVLRAAEVAARQGRWATAIDIVNEGLADLEERLLLDPRFESSLVDFRTKGFDGGGEPRPDWPPDYPDVFAGRASPPEIERAHLDELRLGSALQHHGSLLVRGLLDPTSAARLLDDARRSIAVAESADAMGDSDSTWYRPFEPEDADYALHFARHAARISQCLLLVESPRTLRNTLELYQRAGLGNVIASYLGEWPALSVRKSTIRSADPQCVTRWHQDGAFLGTDVRTVNIWVALTAAGVDAPGLEFFDFRFDHLVESGTHDADAGWSVGDSVARAYGSDRIVAPAFQPGDALMFDQMSLHRAHVTPDMTETRFALETWFFAPSCYPHEQRPLLF